MPRTLRHVVADMLLCKPEDVPQDLIHRVYNTDTYCKRVGASLYSRQVIAVLVEQWEREAPEEPDYDGF